MDAKSLVTLLEGSLHVYQMDIENYCVGQVLDGPRQEAGNNSRKNTNEIMLKERFS